MLMQFFQQQIQVGKIAFEEETICWHCNEMLMYRSACEHCVVSQHFTLDLIGSEMWIHTEKRCSSSNKKSTSNPLKY